MTVAKFQCAEPAVMGIINLTDDSFAGDGLKNNVDAAVIKAQTMQAEGAALIDIGAESTRPNAKSVSTQQELDRIIPVIERCHASLYIPISVDTSNPTVMLAAIGAGASMINDVRALQVEGALAAVAKQSVAVCLMHMQGEPQTMQANPTYQDVVQTVKTFLADRINACIDAGISRECIIIDPGFGFGKSVRHNLKLLAALAQFKSFDLPILVGWSRKSTIGKVLDKPVSERLYGSLAAAVIAVNNGASIIRTHDVAATVDAIKMTLAVKNEIATSASPLRNDKR